MIKKRPLDQIMHYEYDALIARERAYLRAMLEPTKVNKLNEAKEVEQETITAWRNGTLCWNPMTQQCFIKGKTINSPEYRFGEVYEAKPCDPSHTAPGVDCIDNRDNRLKYGKGCGFYGFKNKDQCSSLFKGSGNLIAEVELGGEIVEFDIGYKAQYLKLVSFTVSCNNSYCEYKNITSNSPEVSAEATYYHLPYFTNYRFTHLVTACRQCVETSPSKCWIPLAGALG